MSTLKVHNWDKWQSYRSDRGQPPWIKIHREVMRHIEWVILSDAQRGQLVAIWLLAADHNGVIPASPAIIKKLCHLDTEPDLNFFIEHGFIDGVIVASERRHHDQPETEKRQSREEAETEKNLPQAAFVLPAWIDREQWDLWLKTRKGKKMIPAQMEAQVKKLAKWRAQGLDYGKALADSAASGWQGLFEPKQNISRPNSVQEARLDTMRQIFGDRNETNRPTIDITPGRTIEGDGKSFPENFLGLREPDGE